VRGALLTHYESVLGERYDDFLEEYRQELFDVIGEGAPYFYTYKRILAWGTF
jgi:hypothetical protein